MLKDLIIIGAGNADIVKLIDQINSIKYKWNIIGFTEVRKELIGKEILGYPVLGKDEIIIKYPYAWVTVNIAKTASLRKNIVKKISTYSQKFATLIHPDIDVSYTDIGDGVTIFEGVRLGTNVKIGNFTQIHFNTSIGHDVLIGKYSVINPGASISGKVVIGEEVLVGTGAKIIQGVTIGQGSTIAIGAVVCRSVSSNVTYINYSNKMEIPKKSI